jgi:hypothetical protein
MFFFEAGQAARTIATAINPDHFNIVALLLPSLSLGGAQNPANAGFGSLKPDPRRRADSQSQIADGGAPARKPAEIQAPDLTC